MPRINADERQADEMTKKVEAFGPFGEIHAIFMLQTIEPQPLPRAAKAQSYKSPLSS